MSETPAGNLSNDVIEALTLATMTALRELTQLESLPVPSAADRYASSPVVIAEVPLKRQISSTFKLLVPVKLAERLAGIYLTDLAELSSDIVDDLAGEFANVIAGQAKTILKQTPFHFRIAIPRVSRHSSLSESRALEAGLQSLWFEVEDQALALVIDLPESPDDAEL